jgi:hypothetical protein
MNEDVEDLPAQREKFVGGALEYACRFWTHHILASKTGEDIDLKLDLLQDFFENRSLFWIEILSILGDLGIASYSVQRVQEWLKSVSTPQLQN